MPTPPINVSTQQIQSATASTTNRLSPSPTKDGFTKQIQSATDATTNKATKLTATKSYRLIRLVIGNTTNRALESSPSDRQVPMPLNAAPSCRPSDSPSLMSIPSKAAYFLGLPKFLTTKHESEGLKITVSVLRAAQRHLQYSSERSQNLNQIRFAHIPNS